ncbi:putative methyltransferase [Capsicum galapagoense]
MGESIICFRKCRLGRVMGCIQFVLGSLVILVSLSSLFRFYSAGFFLHDEDICRHFYGVKDVYDSFDIRALSSRVDEVLDKMESLQDKFELIVQEMEKNKDELQKGSIPKLEYKRFLEEEVIKPLYSAHIALRQIRMPRVEGIGNVTIKEDPLINNFVIEEIRKYITPKENRHKKVNIFGTQKIYNTIGHACVSMKKELEEYMDYDIGSYCKDDWNIAQKLMINGCDPLPRRRCLARASKLYQKPYPMNESLWRIPDGRNVRWNNYLCRNYECLSGKNPKRGYTKCTGCFEMEKEELKWVTNSSLPVDFLIRDVLAVKPGEIRIGLDFGIGTGTFAARMREQNVTIISTALNLGAPFSETIALRGLIPLYVTLNQRLPFFDNTMDMIHTAGFMDGWIDLQLLDFILFDWDRVLRPGGLLWIDRFFCNRTDLDDFMYMLLQFRYKKHKWSIAPKGKDEVYLSALLEKPPRSL